MAFLCRLILLIMDFFFIRTCPKGTRAFKIVDNKMYIVDGIYLNNLDLVEIDENDCAEGVMCFICGSRDHIAKKCSEVNNYNCDNCGRQETFVVNCPRCKNAYKIYSTTMQRGKYLLRALLWIAFGLSIFNAYYLIILIMILDTEDLSIPKNNADTINYINWICSFTVVQIVNLIFIGDRLYMLNKNFDTQTISNFESWVWKLGSAISFAQLYLTLILVKENKNEIFKSTTSSYVIFLYDLVSNIVPNIIQTILVVLISAGPILDFVTRTCSWFSFVCIASVRLYWSNSLWSQYLFMNSLSVAVGMLTPWVLRRYSRKIAVETADDASNIQVTRDSSNINRV